MLWDSSIRTDKEIETRRLDLLIIDKRENKCQIIDVVIPDDRRVRAKQDEKVEKYRDLAREIRKKGVIRKKVTPIVVGALGTIPLRIKENLRTIGVGTSIELIQWCALLGSQGSLGKCWRCRLGSKRKNEGRFLAFLGNWLSRGANENQI